MNIRWSVKDMPELAALPDNEKQNVMWDSSLKTFRHWQSWAGVVFCWLCGSIGGHFANIVGAALGGAIGGCVCAQIIVQMQVCEIRVALAKRKGAPTA